MSITVPHLRIVVTFCAVSILGYSGFSLWVVLCSQDAAMRGDVIGTWKSFAVSAFSFWIGASSGGKAKDNGPTPVTVENPPSSPVPVESQQ